MKESDRIATVAEALSAVRRAHRGAPTTAGGSAACRRASAAASCDPHGDHRIAMMGAIAGLYSEHGVRVRDPECIDVSFPGFRDILRALEAAVAERE